MPILYKSYKEKATYDIVCKPTTSYVTYDIVYDIIYYIVYDMIVYDIVRIRIRYRMVRYNVP